MFNFGDKVKDKVTGLEGIIMGKSQYSNGCSKYAIQPQKLKDDGSPCGWEWVDIQQCELIEAGVIDFGDGELLGGPMPEPPQA